MGATQHLNADVRNLTANSLNLRHHKANRFPRFQSRRGDGPLTANPPEQQPVAGLDDSTNSGRATPTGLRFWAPGTYLQTGTVPTRRRRTLVIDPAPDDDHFIHRTAERTAARPVMIPAASSLVCKPALRTGQRRNDEDLRFAMSGVTVSPGTSVAPATVATLN